MSVFDKSCPHCGQSLQKQLRQQAFETGYGFPESGEFVCNNCEGEIEFEFEWGVTWSKVLPVKTAAQQGNAADATSEAPRVRV